MKIAVAAVGLVVAGFFACPVVHADPDPSICNQYPPSQQADCLRIIAGEQHLPAQHPNNICHTGGHETDCTNCANAFGTSGQISYRAGWACGHAGFENWFTPTDTKAGQPLVFPCYVGSTAYETWQKDCDGTLQSDGTILRKNGNLVPLGGVGVNYP